MMNLFYVALVLLNVPSFLPMPLQPYEHHSLGFAVHNPATRLRSYNNHHLQSHFTTGSCAYAPHNHNHLHTGRMIPDLLMTFKLRHNLVISSMATATAPTRNRKPTMAIQGSPTQMSKYSRRPYAGKMAIAEEKRLIIAAQRYLRLEAERKVMAEYLGRPPTESEVATVSQAFQEFGRDNLTDGGISVRQFMHRLCDIAMYCPADEGELQRAVSEIDLDGNGEIQFTEFCAVVLEREVMSKAVAELPEGASHSEVAEEVLAVALAEVCGSLGSTKRIIATHQQHLTEGKSALNRLMQAHQGMVFEVARKSWSKFGVTRSPSSATWDKDDLIQEGMLGFSTAVRRFDVNRATRLSTFAYPYILSYITRLPRTQSKAMVLPDVIVMQMTQMVRARQHLTMQLQRPPSKEELASHLRWSELKLKKRAMTSHSIGSVAPVSLDQPLKKNEPFVDTIADTLADTPKPSDTFLKDALEMAFLDRKEKNVQVVRMYFGLEDGEAHTYRQIAQKLDISAQRAFVIVKSELKHLQKNGGLEDFVEDLI